jgi:hypothetical protein
MNSLRELKSKLHPTLEIVSRSEAPRYRCTKCSNAREREVCHHSYSYSVLNAQRWAGSIPAPLMYLVTAIFPTTRLEVARYVGIWKGENLEGRWTRVPRATTTYPGEQRFLHHSYDTQRRLETDYSDAAFLAAQAFHRIYMASSLELHAARLSGALTIAAPFDLSPTSDTKLQYSRVKSFESGVAEKMRNLGLEPWNDISGDFAVRSSQVALPQNAL